MASINELIQRELNPFDRINLKPGNFWHTVQQSSDGVDSIHQEALKTIELHLDLVAKDHVTRSLLLIGDSGSGKSFLLDRLKRSFNDKAFFAYIGPWADHGYIWRHVLRYMVDSLMQVPTGQQESQLMQWLKGLSVFTQRSLKQRIFNDSFWGLLQNDRQKFIKHLKQTYKTANIHSPDIFFGVLHDLMNPDLYDLACEWLRGDDLSEESMQLLRVKSSVDSEEDAKTILSNFSKIATETQPIVLCFDQLDNLPETDGKQDFQPLFNVNTLLHNDGLKNFLVIVSIITDTWRKHQKSIRSSDKSRFEKLVLLKQITLDQAQALWIEQLKDLHQLAKPRPESPLFPLEMALLETTFPGGKTLPRNAIKVGKEAYQKYKIDRFNDEKPKATLNQTVVATMVGPLNPPILGDFETGLARKSPSIGGLGGGSSESVAPTNPLQAEFKLEWDREHRKVTTKILKTTARSAPELIQMMQEALMALEVPGVKLKLLSGKYASYSLQYKHPGTKGAIGLIWTEDASMRSFYDVMNACQKVTGAKLQLLRTGALGAAKTAGNQIYRQLFESSENQHIKPSLASIHHLATYHSFVNATAARELVLGGKAISLPELAQLARETGVLAQVPLLQDLDIVTSTDPQPTLDKTTPLREYIMNLMTTQQIMGLPTLITSAQKQFPDQGEKIIDQTIAQFCDDQKLSLLNPTEKPARRMICWQPT
jgi:AAA ATPase domain